MSISVLIFFPKIIGFSQYLEFDLHFASQFDKLWPLIVTWVILTCHYGYSSKIKWFLSLPIWMPIEKIGLSLYLIHTFTISSSVISNKQPIVFDGSMKVIEFVTINNWLTEYSFEMFLDWRISIRLHDWLASEFSCSSLHWKALHSHRKIRFKKLVKKMYQVKVAVSHYFQIDH